MLLTTFYFVEEKSRLFDLSTFLNLAIIDFSTFEHFKKVDFHFFYIFARFKRYLLVFRHLPLISPFILPFLYPPSKNYGGILDLSFRL